MDKESIKLSIKRVFTDRPFLMLMSMLTAMGLLYCLVVGLNIHRSDVTVYTRYSAFGEAHFYKDHWQYLLTFVLFGVIVTAAHLALMVKLHNIERRQTALLVGWLGISMLLLALMYALAVMSLGRAA
jgi:hypothetical protein